uniref:Putative conserved proteinconserved protein n=1 Tax=Ixodes ricinus TaxID=34613 RepID=A0A147BT89_IXORI
MPNDATPRPSGDVAAPAQLSRRQRRATRARGGNHSFEPRGGHTPRGNHTPRGGNAPRGNNASRGDHTPRGGFNNRGGFNPRGGIGPRGGFSPRGGYNPRGGFNPRGGYNPSFSPRGNFMGPRGGANRGFMPRGGGAVNKPQPVRKHSVATWTVQLGETVYSYVSRLRWREQGRPTRDAAPESVVEPFKGRTLMDRHPNEPKPVYTEEEREQLCPLCGTLVVHWDTHTAGKLHEERLKAPKEMPSEPTQMDVVAALRVLQATRPDIIAASLAAAPHAAQLVAGRDLAAGPSRDSYGSRGDYELSRGGYESSPDGYGGPRDDFGRSRYGYGPAYDDLGPLDDDLGRSRDGLGDLADEDLDGVPADHLDDLYPLPMRGRSPDDDLYMPPAKFPRGMPPDQRDPPSFGWN